MGGVPAQRVLAKELSLRTSVGLFSMSTLVAALRRVVGINPLHPHAVQPRFVADKGAKLIETPIAPFCPVLMPNPGPQVDARQVFEGDPLFRAFSFQNKL